MLLTEEGRESFRETMRKSGESFEMATKAFREFVEALVPAMKKVNRELRKHRRKSHGQTKGYHHKHTGWR